jgi:hypothetical protein
LLARKEGTVNHKYPLWAATASFALIALACSLFTNVVPTAVPTAVPTQIPPELPTAIPTQTVVAPPTSPPMVTPEDTAIPLPSPDVAATQAISQVKADVKDYYDKGYLPFENGQIYLLDDFSKPSSSLDMFDFTRTGQQSQDFALWADIELDTTGSTQYPDYTGCGFAYRVQNNSDGYTAILTNDAVRMGHCGSGLRQCELFGTLYGFGTGEVRIPNNTKALFSLAVNRDRAFVLVDGKLVGQYALFTTKLLGKGDIYYATVGNINAGYWTSCQISNVRLWESLP